MLLESLLNAAQRHPMPLRFPPIEELGQWIDYVDRAIRHHQHMFNTAVRFGSQTLGRNTVRQVSMATVRHLQNVRNNIKIEMFRRAIQGQQQFLNFHIRHENTRNLHKNLEQPERAVKRFGHLVNYWQNVKQNSPEIRNNANQMIGQYRQLLSEATSRRNNAARRLAGKSIVLGKRNITGRLK